MRKIVKLIIFILFIACFIYLGTKEYKTNEKKKIDVNKATDVLLNGNYVFKEINHSKLLSMLTSKSSDFIFYACHDKKKLCIYYGEIIDSVAKEMGIDLIYYYNFEADKNENNATYQKIVDKLSPYLLTDDLGNQDLVAPTLIFIKNGAVYAIDDEFSYIRGNKSVDAVLTEEVIYDKTTYLQLLMEGYKNYE